MEGLFVSEIAASMGPALKYYYSILTVLLFLVLPVNSDRFQILQSYMLLL